MRRSITIVESQNTAVDISSVEASELNAVGRELASKAHFWVDESPSDMPKSIIRCHFDGERWYMTVHNAVGVIGVGDLHVIVKPKIPLSHFLYLLTLDRELPRFVRDDRRVESSENLLELIAHWFMFALDSVLRRDLICDYVERVDQLAATRGQLEVMATGLDYYSGRLALTCRFEEFDFDTPLNRTLKAGAQVVAGGPEFSPLLHRSASRVLQRLEAVTQLRPSDIGARTDRRTAHYDDAVLLARLLLRREARTIQAGEAAVWNFLIPTPAMVERAIRSLLAAELSDVCRVTKRSVRLNVKGLTVNPDLVFDPDLAIGDVKYKTGLDGISRQDLYQAVAFASAYRCRRALIVSFHSDCSETTARISFGDVAVSHICWNAGAIADPSVAAGQLVRNVRTWLDEAARAG